jgi:PPOX class probable F420-dependent enzyme
VYLLLALVLQALGVPAAPRAAEVGPEIDQLLRTSSYVYLATWRKDGQLGRPSPVWFVWDGGKIFFTTGPDSWKAKRLGDAGPLTVRVGAEDGPVLAGTARRVTDPALIDRMGRAYGDKYWIARLGLVRPRSARVSAGKTVAYLVDVEER